MKKTIGILFCWLAVWLPITAQVEVRVDRPSAVYQSGELIQFNLEGSGEASYHIFSDRFTSSLVSGKIDVHSWENNPIYFKPEQPGVYTCQVYQNFQARTASAVVAPLEIKTKMAAPNDLMSFWNEQLATLSTIPIDPQVTPDVESEYSKSFRFNIGSVDNRRVYGYLSIPKGDAPYPAIVNLPPFGSSANAVQVPSIIAERGGAITVSISIHNAPLNQVDPQAYQPDVIDNRDSLYYKLAVLGIVRAIDYIFTLPEFDGENLAVNGVSQGGGLATIIAGLDSRVKALAYSNSALCVNHGLAYDQASGFPYYLDQSNVQVGTPQHFDQTLSATRYVDAAFFAAQFEGSSIGVVGYLDTICPPQTVLTAHNNLRGSKILYHFKNLGHNHPNEYWDGRIDLYRRLFPKMQTPPWPFADIKTGYFADAGSDQTTTVNTPVSLTAIAYDDDQINSSWRVEWAVVEGTGSVDFSDPTARETTVSFSAAGTYRLRFTAFNEDDINLSGLEAKMVTISDDIVVEVN